MFSIPDNAFVAVLTVIFVYLILKFLFYKEWNLPPGPNGLPFFGYIPFLTWKPHVKLMELKKKYGPVYSLYLGSELVVMLCDFPSIKDAFSKEALMGRPPTSPFELSKETQETGAINNTPWKEQRKFSMHTLRNLGLGKTRMESHIKEEILELLEILEKEAKEPIFISKYLAPSMSNNICSLVFGHRRKHDDPKRIEMDKILKKVGQLVGKISWLSFFPLLRKVVRFLNIGPVRELRDTFNMNKEIIWEEIKEHQNTIDSNNVRDYIDGYLLEVEKRKNDPKSTFQIPILVDLVGMFFGAGSETIRNAVDWLILISAGYPSVQEKVQKEIDSVIGRERFPSRADHHKMPFTEAVIMETLRWRASFPLNLPRYSLEDMSLNSYTIPKNTIVISVFWAVHHDPELWGDDVNCFNPERFLTEDGNEVRKPEYFMPFSIGKRACPGETLAYVETFMYYTAILQKFNLRLPEGATPDFDGWIGFGLQTKPYELVMELRS